MLIASSRFFAGLGSISQVYDTGTNPDRTTAHFTALYTITISYLKHRDSLPDDFMIENKYYHQLGRFN
jgi:hypothetical protein